MPIVVYKSKRATADSLVKASRGVLHSIILNATGTVTAGVVTVYDNVAESGTVLFQQIVPVGATTITVILDTPFTIGCYIGYDGTVANVATTVTYL